jgi:D-alanyl-D-alanine carboxypeptidase/D-alanyl-D-alanine-endopeptidase (penicillin-binding protein 4)
MTRSILVLSAIALAAAGNAYADSGLTERLEATVKRRHGPGTLSVAVYDLAAERMIFGRNENQPLAPASVLKILTGVVALRELGPEYRFETGIWSSPIRGGRVDRLAVRGGADPGLNLESAWILARELYVRGIREIGTLILESSEDRRRVGQRAYETGSSTLAFNYNSLALTVCPSANGKPAQITADPWELGAVTTGQVKTTSKHGTFSVEEVTEGRTPSFRLSGTIGSSQGCETVYRSLNDPEAAFYRVFSSFLRQVGITPPSGMQSGAVPSDLELLFVHRSKPLHEAISEMNHFSSNFIAEQLVLALGKGDSGKFDREAGLGRLGGHLQFLGEKGFEVRDGSGLSHENRLTTKILIDLLREAWKDPRIGVEFLSSLSVGGESGTLKKRSLSADGIVLRGKTGSLDGVSSLAGFCLARDRRIAFAVIDNGTPSKEDAVAVEDAIVDTIFNKER